MANPTPPTLDDARITAYLARLGVARASVSTDFASLSLLHERHLRTIPFENLSIHLGEPIALDVAALADKLTVRRRGGFCYELNGAFSALLAGLGFDVTLHEARVGPDGGGMPFDHLCLRVRLASGAYLTDVGFGASFLRPLDLDATGPQTDPAGVYRIAPVGDGEYDMVEEGTAQYRFSLIERGLEEFAGGCHHHQTSPESHFTQQTICSMATDGGRVTIAGHTLITTVGGRRSEHAIASDDELLDLYRRHFGIVLDRAPDQPAGTPR